MKRAAVITVCTLHTLSAIAITVFAFGLMAQTHTDNILNECKELLFWDAAALVFIGWALFQKTAVLGKVCGSLTILSYVTAAIYTYTLAYISETYYIIVIVLACVAALLTWSLLAKESEPT